MRATRHPPLFRDRHHAGRLLAERLGRLELDDPVVLGLPRGGVPVAYEVAQALGAPLDIALVRKLGAPAQPELGIGAIGEGGIVVVDPGALRALGVSRDELAATIAAEEAELERRRQRYRRDQPRLDVAGRDVVVVDDGLATGVTAVAAARVLRARGGARVIVAVPVSPPGVGEALRSDFDSFVSLAEPAGFMSVGSWYSDFEQVSDAEVVDLLRAGHRDHVSAPSAGSPRGEPVVDPEVRIPTSDGVLLGGSLTLPEHPRGLVIFVHGSGSSRHSPRNRAVAADLASAGLATMLFDLLTEEEASDRRNVFDIGLLTRRLLDATSWASAQGALHGLPTGYFGASTGAAAALCAAAELGDRVAAVVSRGGRPDLADRALPRVSAPTLLIVGGDDWNVLAMNDEAATLLGGPHDLAVVPGAGHLFEEPGALDRVCELATGWFLRHLTRPGRAPAASRGARATS